MNRQIPILITVARVVFIIYNPSNINNVINTISIITPFMIIYLIF
jgi:hypothetical protein